MQPLGILGEGTITAISQGMAISWETTGLWQELRRIAVGSSNIAPAKGDRRFADPAAEKRSETWWQEWTDWGIGHSGGQRPAPEQPGSALYPPLDPAPGRYVTDGGPR
jgi:hypothetical protein